MNLIDSCFTRLAEQGRPALMPYLTLGYPQLDSALALIPALVAGGADVLELGVPFSDPLADGKVIQATSQQAIDNGMTMPLALAQLRELGGRMTLPPVVLMTYTNILMHHGFEQFASDAAAAGVSGLIVPDMPLEESGVLRAALQARGIHFIFMVTPNLAQARIDAIAEVARGFIYMVSVTGVTGERSELPDIADFAARMRGATGVPLALGFGISTPAQAQSLRGQVDGVIIGSALMKRLADPSSACAEATAFLAPFKPAAMVASHA
jgi:tryptophan synthase alpha chain